MNFYKRDNIVNRSSKRRAILQAGLIALLPAVVTPIQAWAQSEKPLRILVGFPAGVTSDTVARLLADKLKDELKRPVVVENKPGAGGRLAAELLKNAPADNSTIMLAPVVVPVLAPIVFNKLNYNPDTDFVPIGHVCDYDFGLAVPSTSPVRSMRELAAAIKIDPGKFSYGSPAAGSLPHFFGVMIGDALEANLTHVSFNGGTGLQTALLGGHVPMGIDVIFEMLQNAKAGKVRVLATSGQMRSKLLPDVPTFKEQGYPNIVGKGWLGMYAPAKTAPEQIELLNKSINKILGLPDVKERFLAVGFEVGGGGPGDLKKLMQEDSKRWLPIFKKSGFRAD